MTDKGSARLGRMGSLAVPAWPLRRKVALAIAIPLLLAATLGGLQVRGDLTAARNSSASAEQVTVLRPAVDYLTAAERAMVAAQDPSKASQADLAAAVRDLQAAAKQLQQTRDTADLTTEQRYQVDVTLDLSRALREATATATLSPGTWLAQLRQLQSGVTRLTTSIVNAQLDPEPRLELLAQTLGGRFSLSMQQALAATERKGGTGSLELFAELGAEGAAIDRLASAVGDEPAIATLRTENAQRSRTVRTGGDDLGGVDAYTEYDGLTEKLLDGIDDQLAAAASSARTSALVNGGLTLAALLAAILLALLVSRLLLHPIRKVREGALNVAHEQLPAAVARIRAGEHPGTIVPIDVTTTEEVGQLARAVDDMHRQAVLLASGEASLRSQVGEMFVTLSRRNTSLINQQLGLIEKLEQDEEDPRRLQSLFRLDHLASRMRRTADSLLILADAPSHAGAQEDLTVAASLQAATAGVQDYQRVRIGSAGTKRISDHAAADVVHLLTELVDNALTYSAPETTVTLSSTAAPDGVTIEIADAGLGIPDRSLAAINQTLRSGGDVTPLTARRMGLFVVSRLAQRHGITASLRRNQHNGITATVVLPSSILGLSSVPEPSSPATMQGDAQDELAVTVPPARGNLAARLNAAKGLPTRQPGASPEIAPLPVPAPAPPAVLPALPVRTPAAQAFTPAALPERTPAPEPALTLVPPVPARDPLTDPLTGPLLLDPSEDGEEETPIFRDMRSAWLSPDGGEGPWRSSEVEEGWERADSVAVLSKQSPVNAAGLPVRRPGTSLVPGGVSKPATATARDPEAIRARLAAHAAGVSRGRTAAAATAHDQQSTEAGPA